MCNTVFGFASHAKLTEPHLLQQGQVTVWTSGMTGLKLENKRCQNYYHNNNDNPLDVLNNQPQLLLSTSR